MPNLSLSPGDIPEDTPYPLKVRQLVYLLAQTLRITGAEALEGVVVSTDEPGQDNLDKLWVKIDATGRPVGIYYYQGGWQAMTLPAPVGKLSTFPTLPDGVLVVDTDSMQIKFSYNGRLETPRTTAFSYVHNDTTVRQITGLVTDYPLTTLSVDVPPGALHVSARVALRTTDTTNTDTAGKLLLYIDDVAQDFVPTHVLAGVPLMRNVVLGLQAATQITEPKTVEIKVTATTEFATTDWTLGEGTVGSPGDSRFGRKIFVIGGL